MPPGLLPTPFLDRPSEYVPTHLLDLDGLAADQTPRCGNSRPTNTDNASLSHPKPKCRCGSDSVLVQARLRRGATSHRRASDPSRRRLYRSPQEALRVRKIHDAPLLPVICLFHHVITF